MTKQIAIKLPEELLGDIDRLVEDGRFDSRSQAVRSGLEAIVEAHRSAAVDQSYRDAMRRLPETDEEMAEAARLATDAICDEPWERWW